jgi:hypothetical protein
VVTDGFPHLIKCHCDTLFSFYWLFQNNSFKFKKSLFDENDNVVTVKTIYGSNLDTETSGKYRDES